MLLLSHLSHTLFSGRLFSSRSLYRLRFLAIPVWSLVALLVWTLTRLRIFVWLATLPERVASVALILASHPETIVLVSLLIGVSSLLLWRWFAVRWAIGLAVLLPLLLLAGGVGYGRIDTQGTEQYVIDAARQGNVERTREQLLIHMARYQLFPEVQALIEAGTRVNVQDPMGRSALYWGREADVVKLLLDAGAKPDGKALVEAAFWGRADIVRLLFAATPDDGKALVAEVGDQAMENAVTVRASGEQDRQQIIQMLIERGVKPLPQDRSYPSAAP